MNFFVVLNLLLGILVSLTHANPLPTPENEEQEPEIMPSYAAILEKYGKPSAAFNNTFNDAAMGSDLVSGNLHLVSLLPPVSLSTSTSSIPLTYPPTMCYTDTRPDRPLRTHKLPRRPRLGHARQFPLHARRVPQVRLPFSPRLPVSYSRYVNLTCATVPNTPRPTASAASSGPDMLGLRAGFFCCKSVSSNLIR
jgi:hypothetical protein